MSDVLDKKSISNEKQKLKTSNEPHGHSYEAVAHFKQYADQCDPFYVYSINDRRGNPNKPSFVFKSSTLKAQFALKMDRTMDNVLSEEVCFFYGKVSRCKGFVSLTASVYHPVLRKVVPLATMECEAEDSLSVEHFWKCFNEVLQKVSGKKDYLFNPCGWITDMAGANMEGLKRVFGAAVLERVRTCEFHFKECRNRQSRKFNHEVRGRFKTLCNSLLEAQSTTAYEKAKDDLDNFIAESPERSSLKSWLEWWNKRRAFIFPAFQHVSEGPKMNLAEVVHASWAKRDNMNMSLLDAAYADARDNIQLDVEYKAFRDGASRVGTGPSLLDKKRNATVNQLEIAKTLGEELTREDIVDQDRAVAPPKNTLPFTTPHDRHNASVTSGPQKSSQARPGRYRATRSKHFIDRFEKAKQEKDSLKVKVANADFTRGLSYTIATPKCKTYRVCIGAQHTCECPDFARSRTKDLCKHIIWTLLYVCQIPENNATLQQVSLTDDELQQIVANTPKDIPSSLRWSETQKSPQLSRQDKIKVLLANDARNSDCQTWYLGRKEKKRGQTPRCRSCRVEIEEGDLCIYVTGLYVPFGQNFVIQTNFYFCPETKCINRLPFWTNLKPPKTLVANSSVTNGELTKMNFGQTKLIRE